MNLENELWNSGHFEIVWQRFPNMKRLFCCSAVIWPGIEITGLYFNYKISVPSCLGTSRIELYYIIRITTI